MEDSGNRRHCAEYHPVDILGIILYGPGKGVGAPGPGGIMEVQIKTWK